MSGGARAVGSPTASAWFPVQVARFPVDLLYADTRRLPMAEVDPLGDSRRGACTHLPTRPSFVSWSSRAYWPIGSPIAGRQEPCPRARRSRRGAGSPLPGARYLRSTLCACRPHLPRRAPIVPGVNVIRPGGVQTRDPQRWLRSPHTVCSPAASVPVGAVSFRGTVSFDTLPTGAVTAVAPPGAERHRFGCRLGRSTSSSYRPFHPPHPSSHRGGAWGGAVPRCGAVPGGAVHGAGRCRCGAVGATGARSVACAESAH